MEYKNGFRIFGEADIPDLMGELFGLRTPKAQSGVVDGEAVDPNIIEAQFSVIEDQAALGSGKQVTNKPPTEIMHG